ncbi:MAG: hypothetical protein ASARMPREDX12_001800 [Alectoria sarmentosa]|nr:MAG: hypothetical protein ASARMPREDX12_001800 [Alectoria sarmentosa]CAD6592383.1 MAG: hypothetical protein ASARMPRED_006242 [Alectoria sarmentosa]
MALPSSVTDALIIGGSHAGLSAALTLYRALHTTIIFDEYKPRNWYPSPVRLTPTWEHKDPERLREASRAELRESGLCRFVDATIQQAEKLSNGLFQVTDTKGGLWYGRKILLTTGVKDIFPNLDGYEENYPQRMSVPFPPLLYPSLCSSAFLSSHRYLLLPSSRRDSIYSFLTTPLPSRFPCMFQFGYEQRNASSAGLLAIDGLANAIHAPRIADDAHKFTDIITIYTNANAPLAAEISMSLQTPNIRVDDREIARLTEASQETKLSPSTDSEIIVEFANGETAIESFLVHRPLTELNRTLSDQLGLDYIPGGQIATIPPFCETSMEGVFAAGDCASMMKIIPNAISMGSYAGAGMARQLPRRVTGK